MSTVSQVFIVKPRPGHLEAFMRDLGRVNTLVKRAGATMRAWNRISGTNQGAIAVLSRMPTGRLTLHTGRSSIPILNGKRWWRKSERGRIRSRTPWQPE